MLQHPQLCSAGLPHLLNPWGFVLLSVAQPGLEPANLCSKLSAEVTGGHIYLSENF